ncbi:hypothetical protein MHPYR_400057 [uncultured Mycobacterium sp.]|uniref:Uncharacterized protein n=1 Tax=uncultured Mycobacterium sp. TaxID=171292 RepID=A0A1Y5PF05_9MYCO|nr:hypothetical protein MHPYR_400057 [uncultured Mycobacterium sp.]
MPVKLANFRQTPRSGRQTGEAAGHPFAVSANLKLFLRLEGMVTGELIGLLACATRRAGRPRRCGRCNAGPRVARSQPLSD